MSAPLPVIGRERAIVNRLAEALNSAVGGPPLSKAKEAILRRQHASSMWETARGCEFEIRVVGDSGPTGHIVRVTVEIDRFEAAA